MRKVRTVDCTKLEPPGKRREEKKNDESVTAQNGVQQTRSGLGRGGEGRRGHRRVRQLPPDKLGTRRSAARGPWAAPGGREHLEKPGCAAQGGVCSCGRAGGGRGAGRRGQGRVRQVTPGKFAARRAAARAPWAAPGALRLYAAMPVRDMAYRKKVWHSRYCLSLSVRECVSNIPPFQALAPKLDDIVLAERANWQLLQHKLHDVTASLLR